MSDDATPHDPAGEDPLLDELTERGWEALQDEDPDAALEIGRTLARAGHASGFELQALALGDLGRMDEAIAVLHRAIAQSPADWRPRQMLGNVLAGLDRSDEALEVFGAALECPEADVGLLQCNASIALAQAGRHFDALQRIAGVAESHPHHWLRLGVQEARLYIELER